MKLTNKRRNDILTEIIKKGSVTVHHLSNEFSVSYETIRKDLTFLDQKGYIIKEHGGATALNSLIENSFTVRQEKQIKLKKLIAIAAFKLILDNSSIILGSGSTVLELAKLLVAKKNLKIYTDSFPVATALANSDNELYFFGGKIRAKSSSVYGGWTNEEINSIKANMCFIGSDNFAGHNGPTTPSYSDYGVDKLLLEHSNKKYVLADSTKFEGSSLYQITNWENITALITNVISKAQVDSLASLTNIIQAKNS